MASPDRRDLKFYVENGLIRGEMTPPAQTRTKLLQYNLYKYGTFVEALRRARNFQGKQIQDRHNQKNEYEFVNMCFIQILLTYFILFTNES